MAYMPYVKAYMAIVIYLTCVFSTDDMKSIMNSGYRKSYKSA